jgi:hypothetical protein
MGSGRDIQPISRIYSQCFGSCIWIRRSLRADGILEYPTHLTYAIAPSLNTVRTASWAVTLYHPPSRSLVSKMFFSRWFIPIPSILCFLTLWLTLISTTLALGKTDTITWGGSNDRTGYQSNHNMDPAIVGSPQFGLLFKTLLPGTYTINGQSVPEQIFSQPLVYTGSDGIQYVYIATTQNNVYKMNAKTGVIVASRNLHRPFLVSDLDGCTDINPLVGVTATGVIDPATVSVRPLE